MEKGCASSSASGRFKDARAGGNAGAASGVHMGMVVSASTTITADRLADYLMGRLRPAERARLRQALDVDPALRGALRRLRRTAHALRERCGESSGAGTLPGAWLELAEAIAHETARAPMNADELARERKLTWL